MMDIDTFLTTLYVMVDDFCKSQLTPDTRPGPTASLSRSEVLTLAIFSQRPSFGSERGFYRYAQRHLRAAFPTVPARSQFNRLLRQYQPALVECLLREVKALQAQHCAFEALDSTAAPTHDAKRRGRGWLPGLADIGWSNRLGWYEGFQVLLAVNPVGVITDFGYAAASTKDPPLAETCFALRQRPEARLRSVGAPAQGPDVTDKGVEGQAWQKHWQQAYGVQVICPPKRNSRRPWSRAWRRGLAGIRQIVETVTAHLKHGFRLDRERPHELCGFQARLAAKVTLHNFCIWLNEQLGRPRLAFADLFDW
ncbi:MAG TPA: transposase [Candidatus Competibacteraceae bacterium]|nr:transposase [Candidatus Competibacteraceae bacterium]